MKENQFWMFLLGDRNTLISVELFEQILSIKSIQKQEIILHNIEYYFLERNMNNKRLPELYECLINFILRASEEDSNPQLFWRQKASILLDLTIKTQKARTNELSQNFELLSNSSSQSILLIDEFYEGRYAPCQTTMSLIKTVNAWYTIYVLNMMTEELLGKQDGQADVDDKMLATLSQTIQCFSQIDKSLPQKLYDQTSIVFEDVKDKKVTLYNSLADLEQIYQELKEAR